MTSEFIPSAWPEVRAPEEIIHCTKCELHCQRSKVVWGEGNPYASIIAVLDNPGAREDKEGNPFVCGTRITMQQAAFNAGFNKDDLYVTYILKCRPVKRYDKDEARNSCLEYLELQINQQQPRFAICLGNTAVQWFFSDMSAEVKNLRGKVYNIKGIQTVVTYHPLAVRRKPNLMKLFTEDWKLLAQCAKKDWVI